MSSDKKFKLDELSDEGSSIEPPKDNPPPKKSTPSKKEADPRIARMKKLDDEKKVEEMVQRWHFDKKVNNYGWLIYVMLIVALQYINPYEQYLLETEMLAQNSMGFGEVFNLGVYVEELVRRPIVFVFLTPFFFKFSSPSVYFFDLSFDGISTVRSVEIDAEVKPSRVFLKWDTIVEVQKKSKGSREVLQLLSPEGRIGELIWDITDEKKRAVKLLLKGLIKDKHPLRQFLEKDVK